MWLAFPDYVHTIQYSTYLHVTYLYVGSEGARTLERDGPTLKVPSFPSC